MVIVSKTCYQERTKGTFKGKRLGITSFSTMLCWMGVKWFARQSNWERKYFISNTASVHFRNIWARAKRSVWLDSVIHILLLSWRKIWMRLRVVMSNYQKIKQLRIKPEKIRELINQIENQTVNLNAIKSNLMQGVKSQVKRGNIWESPIIHLWCLRIETIIELNNTLKQKSINIINNNIRSMAVRYISDELVAEIRNRKFDVQDFIKEAIEEKLRLKEEKQNAK